MENKVLVVDDEKELAYILKDFLENEGIKTQVAFTGAECEYLLKTFD